MGSQARVTQYQHPTFIRLSVAYNTAGIATGVIAGYVPAGARFTVTHYWVETAQNAGTTNTLSVGYIPTDANGRLTASITPQTQLVNAVTTAATTQANVAPSGTAGVAATDLAIIVSLAQTGTAATAGVVTVGVQYITNL